MGRRQQRRLSPSLWKRSRLLSLGIQVAVAEDRNAHLISRADQNRCVLKTSDGGRRDNTNVDSGQRPCTTTTTTTTTPPPPLSCHECDQFVGCASPDDVGNVTTCPPTTSHCMVSVNEGTGTVFRRCSSAHNNENSFLLFLNNFYSYFWNKI